MDVFSETRGGNDKMKAVCSYCKKTYIKCKEGTDPNDGLESNGACPECYKRVMGELAKYIWEIINDSSKNSV